MSEIFAFANDIALSYDGDLIVDGTNDLKSVSGIEWFKREVNKIIRSKIKDWKTDPTIGLDLDDFIGKVNTQETAAELQEKILDALTLDNFQFPGSFEIKIIPISSSDIVIYIIYNIIGETYPISKLIYNLDRGISLSITDELIEEPIKLKPKYIQEKKNPYLAALGKR